MELSEGTESEDLAMPVLPAEPSLYPLNMFESSPAGGDARWWVLHTRPRAEKALARLAVRHAVPFFLPLHIHRWRNQGRTFSAHLPLFPGYLFVHADEEMRPLVLDRRYVANCIGVPDQGRLWADLGRVYRLMQSGVGLTPRERVAKGDWVVITAGPFAGFEGKVLRSSRELKFAVEVEFIQRGVEVEIEDWMLEPARQAPCA